MAAVGFAGRYVIRQMPNATSKFAEAVKNLPKFDSETLANSKYFKGGFESKMTKREAALILGVSPTANKAKVDTLSEHIKMHVGTYHISLKCSYIITYFSDQRCT